MADSENLQALRRAILDSPAYRLAQEDPSFLAEEDLRPLRLQLELLKPEHALRREGIASTIVVFGSARIASPERAAENPPDPCTRAHARYYEEARRYAHRVSTRFQQEGRRDFVVVTGGRPGILDELFEVLTLVQTGKMARIPIVLVGTEFWRRVIDFGYLWEEGFVSEVDLQCSTYADTAEEIITVLETFYGSRPPPETGPVE